MSKKKEEKIYSLLSSIDDTLKKQSSNKSIFMQGLIRGLGTALGATVLLAIVTSLTIQFVDALDWGMFSDYFFGAVVSE